MTDDVKVVPVAVPKVDEIKNLDPEIQARDVKWRAHAKSLADENESLKSVSAKEKADLLSKIDSASKAEQQLKSKVVAAELKAQAVAAGLKDLDFIKMIDTKGLIMKEDGTIEGIEKAVEELKASKPILFGAEKKMSSSKNHELPNKTEVPTLDAFKMTDAEFVAEKAKLGLY
jgi:hypothetical protein